MCGYFCPRRARSFDDWSAGMQAQPHRHTSPETHDNVMCPEDRSFQAHVVCVVYLLHLRTSLETAERERERERDTHTHRERERKGYLGRQEFVEIVGLNLH